MFRTLILFLSSIALSGCAALNIKRGVSEDDLNKTQRIGVLSVLGDTFQGVFVGTTVFNNQAFSGTVTEWKVDSYASNKALEILRSNSKFQTELIDRSGMSVDKMKADSGKLLFDAAAKQGFDRLVILSPGASDNFKFFRPSYGIYERSFFGKSVKCVYAAYTVEVYDVGSRKPIAWEWGGDMPCEHNKDNDLAFKSSFSEYSEAERAVIRKRLLDRLDESVRYALEKLSLVQKVSAAK